MPGLIGQRGVERASSASDGRCATLAAERGRIRAREIDQSDLEQAQLTKATTEVASERREQARQERGAQLGFGVRQRVGDDHRAPARVVGGQAELVVQCRRDERVAQHFGIAGGGERSRQGPP